MTQEPSPTKADVGPGPGLPYLPGLDGLRALAVMAVLIYHADARWLPGGFLGVDVFFVISGYLITSLLLSEFNSRGRIDVPRFWLRRARRLLPAVIVLIACVLTFAVLFLPDEVAGLRGDAAASAAYVSNWYLIFSHKSYFEAVGRPSLLRHLWSLAVEEQFYLLWPLLLAGLLALMRPRRAMAVVLTGVVASTALMAALFEPGTDPSRVYYGTDTRAAALLIGAALAFVLVPDHVRATAVVADEVTGTDSRHPHSVLVDAVGLAALGGLTAFFVLTHEASPFLYRGGFLLLALTAAALIAVCVHPRARLLPALFSLAPLRWMGLRSYGIYLWHWPVFMLTRPGLDLVLAGISLMGLRIAATFALAEASYRFVETPIRGGALERSLRSLRDTRGPRRRWLSVRWAAAIAALLVLTLALGQSLAAAQPPPPPAYLTVQSIDTVGQADLPSSGVSPAPDPGTFIASQLASNPAEATAALQRAAGGEQSAPNTASMPTGGSAAPTALPAATPEVTASAALDQQFEPVGTTGPAATLSPPNPRMLAALDPLERYKYSALPESAMPPASPTPAVLLLPPPSPPPGGTPSSAERVTAIGDSVMIASAGALQKTIPNIEIDAVQGRQIATSIRVLRARREAGQLGQVVVLHLGNNGYFDVSHFGQIMDLLDAQRRVVFVNVKVPQPWESLNNRYLVTIVPTYPNAVLVDWHGATAGQPGLFWGDGFHPRKDGAQLYADLISAAIQAP